MPVLIKLSATLRDYVPGYEPMEGLTMNDAHGKTVRRVMDELGLPADKVKIILVNGLSAEEDRILNDGDRLGLFPPVGGG